MPYSCDWQMIKRETNHRFRRETTHTEEKREPQQTNVIHLLIRDHEKAKTLLDKLDGTPDAQLCDYFDNLREELVRHEVAEELIVYPAFRKNVAGGDSIADACIAEQAKAEETLAALEKEDSHSRSFRTQLAELRQSVLAHAKHEEHEVFPALEANTRITELEELGDRYDRAQGCSDPPASLTRLLRGGAE